MTENEKEYSEYIKDLSKLRVTMISLISGFTFTTITILLNQLPDPSSLMSQLTFLFLTIVFNLLVFLLMWQTVIFIGVYNVPNLPPRGKWEGTAFNLTMWISFAMWGFSLVLMFLLWNLIYLALASAISWVVVNIATEAFARGMRKRLGWSISEEMKKALRRETQA